MRCATAHFLNVAKAIYKSGNIAGAHIRVACAEAPLAIAAHSIHVTAIALHKDRVFFTAADIGYNDIEATDLGQVVNYFIAADSELSIVVI